VHTNDAPSTVSRLLDMGAEDYLLTSTINGILAQRLVRTLCPKCREPHPALPGTASELGTPLTQLRGQLGQGLVWTGRQLGLLAFEFVLELPIRTSHRRLYDCRPRRCEVRRERAHQQKLLFHTDGSYHPASLTVPGNRPRPASRAGASDGLCSSS